MNGITVHNPLALLALVLALATGFVAVGVGVSLFTPVRQRAQLLYSTAILVVFGGAAVLPEHPATTVAQLAVGSADAASRLFVVGYAVVALALLLGVRRVAARTDGWAQ
jgi:hypothetical protein